MVRLTVDSIQRQSPRMVLDRLIRCNPRDTRTLVGAVANWILVHVDVVDEFEELLIAPMVMIQIIDDIGRASGDCDDIAMLAASILAAGGASVYFVALDPASNGSFGHVAVAYAFPADPNYFLFDGTIASYYTPIDLTAQALVMEVKS